MEAKHTPGPWRLVDGYAPAFQCSIWPDDDGGAIAVTYNDEGSANARLIAAAPDLCAVLREFVIQHEMGLQHIEGLYDLARAAIAKATSH